MSEYQQRFYSTEDLSLMCLMIGKNVVKFRHATTNNDYVINPTMDVVIKSSRVLNKTTLYSARYKMIMHVGGAFNNCIVHVVIEEQTKDRIIFMFIDKNDRITLEYAINYPDFLKFKLENN